MEKHPICMRPLGGKAQKQNYEGLNAEYNFFKLNVE